MLNSPHEVAWIVSIILVEAAVIDGLKLRVPNWLTFHLVLGGLAYGAWSHGASGLFWATAGMLVGLATLLPLYAIGGMGAGDVKLLAGVGAWMGPWVTLWAFVVSALVGAAMALVMATRSGDLGRHIALFRLIGREIVTVRDPVRLSELAAARKPTMLLLPYGIPIAIGSIGYFGWAGMLF